MTPIYCSVYSNCFARTMFAMLADLSSFQSPYFNSMSRSTSTSNSFSLMLLLFYSSSLSLATSSSIIFTRQPCTTFTSASNLIVQSSSMCLMMVSLSFSYLSFSLRYLSSRFSNRLISSWLHLASSSSVLLLSLSSCKWDLSFWHWAVSISVSCRAASSSLFRAFILSGWHFLSRQTWSIFMDPALLLRGISQVFSNSLKRSSVSMCRGVFFSGLSVGVAGYRWGDDAKSSSELQVNFLSEPERQLRVCMELRLTNLLEFSVWVGREPLLSFFLALMGFYSFISTRFMRLIQFYLIKLISQKESELPYKCKDS